MLKKSPHSKQIYLKTKIQTTQQFLQAQFIN